MRDFSRSESKTPPSIVDVLFQLVKLAFQFREHRFLHVPGSFYTYYNPERSPFKGPALPISYRPGAPNGTGGDS
jgi:hypothetical protein